jgi:TetR/AcrR family transcriptional regulator
MARGRKRAEDPAMARRILAAAERHFAAEGLAGARTEEIATEARANKAMLYYYFGSKRRLHRAVLENLLGQLRSVVVATEERSLSPRERFLGHVSSYYDFLATHPNYPRLMQHEAMEGKRNFDWIVREYFHPLHKKLVRTLKEGIAAGELREVDADQMVLITLGMVASYFASARIMSQVVGRNLLAPRAIALRKRALLDFLDHGVVRKGVKSR